jgi:amidase
VSLGTETDGSVVCPGNANGVVGLKPTVGLTSRYGVVPISHTQDTVGIHARTVADAAATLGVIQTIGGDGHDAATSGVPLGWQGTGKMRPVGKIPTDYTQFLNPNGLQGARIGVTRAGLSGFGPPGFPNFVATPQSVLDAFETTVDALAAAGATVVDLDKAGFTFSPPDGEFFVLVYDFKGDVANYFATRSGVPVSCDVPSPLPNCGTLEAAIEFNNAHPDTEMPFFNQDIFDFSQSIPLNPSYCNPNFTSSVLLTTGNCMTYLDALTIDHLAGVNGIDAALKQFNLDAVFSATDNPAWATDLLYGDHFLFGTSSLAAAPGYPIIQVPAAMPQQCSSPTLPTNCTSYGVPLGVSFFGTAFSEPILIKLASGFEAQTQFRAHHLPTFAVSAPSTNIQGTTLTVPRRHADPVPPVSTKKIPHRM